MTNKAPMPKLIWTTKLSLLCALSSSPCFADTFYDDADQASIQVSPWADFQASPAPAALKKIVNAVSYMQQNPPTLGQRAKSSKPTNTNLRKDLPPTWTCNNMTELNVYSDGEPEPPSIDPVDVIETFYDIKDQVDTRMEVASDAIQE